MKKITLLFMFVFLSFLILYSLGSGAVHIPITKLINALMTQLGASTAPPLTSIEYGVLTEIRLPRILMALLVGSGLSIAGAMMQGLFRNPLADPGLIGVSSGAALGVAIVIVMGANYLIPIVAFSGAMISTLCVIKLSTVGSKTNVANMLLAGIANKYIAPS